MEKSTFSSPRRRRIPEHIRSVAMFSGAYPFTLPSMGVNRPFHSRIPEDIRSFSNHNALTAHVFRNISVHFSMVFRYPGRDILNSETTMAGKPISMSDFKQAILLKKQGVSNRRIAEQLGINKETAEFRVAGAKADEAEATDEENDITPVDPDTFESLLHIPAGATMIGIHANSKGNIFLANFKVGKFVLSGIDEIQSDELLGTLPADARDIRVYDLAGQEVARFATVEEIDFSGLTKGIYILNAISQKGKVSFKLTL